MVWPQVRPDGEAVRLFSQRGFDWSTHYPAIVRTAPALPAKSFTLDGEAVVCSGDGVAVFENLHGRRIVRDAMLHAFDQLEFGGEDLRLFPPPIGRGTSQRPSASAVSESCSRTTPTSIYSGRFVRWGWRASSRSGSHRPTDRAARRTG